MLARIRLARLACARNNQPYVVPIHVDLEGGFVYAYATLGQKIEWMRENPLVCVEMDDLTSHGHPAQSTTMDEVSCRGVAVMRSTIGLSTLGMLCWIVMFLAGTDVWHFAGSPEFWRLPGAPYTDLRAFGYAFYLQFFTLLTMIVVTSWTALKAR